VTVQNKDNQELDHFSSVTQLFPYSNHVKYFWLKYSLITFDLFISGHDYLFSLILTQ